MAAEAVRVCIVGAGPRGVRACLRLAGGAAHAAAELVEGLQGAPGRMRDNLGAPCR